MLLVGQVAHVGILSLPGQADLTVKTEATFRKAGPTEVRQDHLQLLPNTLLRVHTDASL
jgi:hypothetical protein